MHWTLHTTGGPRRVNHAATIVGHRIFSFGGYCSDEEHFSFNPISVHVLDADVFRWNEVARRQIPDVPFHKYGHSCVAYGDKIYLWGGRNDNVACDRLYCFDTNTFKWTTPSVTGCLPNGKDGHSACIVNNKMYIFGGFDYFSAEYTNDLHSLDLETMEWVQICGKGTPPEARDFHTAHAYGNQMYVFGGRSPLEDESDEDELYCNTVYYFDTTNDTWTKVKAGGTIPIGRRSHSSWIYNDYMYIFGGYNDLTKLHYNDVHRFSLKSNNWETVSIHGIPPTERRRQACILYNNKIFLFGGTSPCLPPLEAQQKVDNEDDDNNVMENDDLHILDYLPTLKDLCIMCVKKNDIKTYTLPHDLKLDISLRTNANKISFPLNMHALAFQCQHRTET